MATAYKYVERKAEDQINWAEVGSNLTNTLKEENRVRVEKKAAIDDATREMQNVLNNVPQGENTQLNEFALNAGADLQEIMLMQETLLKSGQLDPRQYTITRQNLADGTNQAFSLFENYNAEYKRKMEMNNSNLPVGEQASEIQNWSMGLVEGFGNFQESKLIINPNTGIMSMAKMIEDPNNPGGPRIPDQDNLMTVQNLENRIKGTYTKYDVMGNVDSYAATLGTDVEVQRKMGNYRANGLVTQVTDITRREGFGSLADLTDEQIEDIAAKAGIDPADVKVMSMYEKAEDTWVKSQLGIGDNSAASVLVDFLGAEYSPTMDPKEAKADPNKVLMVNNNGKLEAELTDEQQAKAEEVMKVQLRLQLDKKEEYKAAPKDYNAPTYAPKDVRDDAKGDEQLDAKVSKIADLYNGDNMEIKGATDYFRDQNEDIKDVTRSANGIVVTYTNSEGEEESRDISFYVMEDNPAFDDTKEESETNPKMIRAKISATQADVDAGRATSVGEQIDQRKSQEEFIESAGPLLTGESDISKSLERGGYNKDKKFNVDGESTSKVKSKEVPRDYTVEKTNFVNKQLDKGGITLAGQDDVKVADNLNTLYGNDYGLVAKTEGSMSNIVRISVPGYDDVTIDTNNYTDAGVNTQMKKLRQLVLLMTKKDDARLARENKWKGKDAETDANGVPIK